MGPPGVMGGEAPGAGIGIGIDVVRLAVTDAISSAVIYLPSNDTSKNPANIELLTGFSRNTGGVFVWLVSGSTGDDVGADVP
jgi:hypothetical protein